MKKSFLSFIFFAVTIGTWAQAVEKPLNVASVSEQTNLAALALFNKGVEYSNNKQYGKGIECYEQAIVMDSGYIDAYNNLGFDFLETNVLDSAAYYLHISLRKKAANVTALTNLGLVEEKQGDLQGALGHFQQIEKLEPQNPEGYYNAAAPLLDLGRLQEALAAGKQAEKLFEAALQ